MRHAAIVMAALLVPLAGCADIVDQLTRPDYTVRTTPMDTGDTWNTENRFRVTVDEGVHIVITARETTTGQSVQADGAGDVTLALPDGTWAIRYDVDGYEWGRLEPVRVDATPPLVDGLEFVGDAVGGAYTLGADAELEPGVQVRVLDAETGQVLARSLPWRATGLADGLHVYLVQLEDEAGNILSHNVQVRSGDAAQLPDGAFTFGVVARYTNEARVWDLTDLDAYDTIGQAQAATGGRYLGAGYGVEPDATCVRQVVDRLVTPSMGTVERALVLFEWMADNLEYDEQRLSTDTLLRPCQVMLDQEDPSDADRQGDGARDGLVLDGPGNGVKGGICRDLAATYVSMLRAAGVPARLVSGYLAGEVDGFHAWVEFYGGSVDGQGPWIPVDVSVVDGPYDPGRMLQAFGIQLPEYLALRRVPESAEVQGWSTALSVEFTWPQGTPEPKVTFQKEVTPVFANMGVLCVHEGTRARQLAADSGGCPHGRFDRYIPDFVRRTERTIDYGVLVERSSEGTKVTAGVAYPFPESVAPDDVVFAHYGPGFTRDVQAGKATTTFEPGRVG